MEAEKRNNPLQDNTEYVYNRSLVNNELKWHAVSIKEQKDKVMKSKLPNIMKSCDFGRSIQVESESISPDQRKIVFNRSTIDKIHK